MASLGLTVMRQGRLVTQSSGTECDWMFARQNAKKNRVLCLDEILSKGSFVWFASASNLRQIVGDCSVVVDVVARK